jgi:uncharacterized protein DUF4190
MSSPSQPGSGWSDPTGQPNPSTYPPGGTAPNQPGPGEIWPAAPGYPATGYEPGTNPVAPGAPTGPPGYPPPSGYPTAPGYPGGQAPGAYPAAYGAPPGYPPSGYATPNYPSSGYAGYGAYPGYTAYPSAQRTNGLAIAAMVVSIVSVPLLLCYGFGGLLGVAGAIMGHVARRQVRDTGEQGNGMALAGIIVGWVTTGLAIIGVVLLIVGFALIGSITPTTPDPFSS